MAVIIRALTFVALTLAVSACEEGSSGGPIVIDPPPLFVARGLAGATVVGLVQADDQVFAGTDRGIYRLQRDGQWLRVAPEHWSVLSIEALASSRLLASVAFGRDHYELVESQDGGLSWNILAHDFGGPASSIAREPVQRLHFDDQRGELLATGYGALARSSDHGRSWEVLDGDWGRVGTGLGALSVAMVADDIWYGGQGAIEDPILLRYSRSGGESVDFSTEIEALLPRPSTVESVRFYPTSDSTVFVAGEGGVIRSSDAGSSWEPVLVNSTSRFYFDLLIDDRSGTIFTAGWDKDFTNPQALRLEVSTDSGITWTAYRHENPDLQGGVWSMAFVELDGRRRLFLGLQGGGVYEVDLRRF